MKVCIHPGHPGCSSQLVLPQLVTNHGGVDPDRKLNRSSPPSGLDWEAEEGIVSIEEAIIEKAIMEKAIEKLSHSHSYLLLVRSNGGKCCEEAVIRWQGWFRKNKLFGFSHRGTERGVRASDRGNSIRRISLLLIPHSFLYPIHQFLP